MAFFEELGKKAQAVAGVAAEKAKDLAGVASEKAKSVSDSAKASMEIISEQREMEKNYRAIGEWFVSEYEGEVPDAVKDVVAAVIASKERIGELEAAKAAKKEGESCPCSCEEQPAGEETQQKVCPVCGEFLRRQVLPQVRRPHGRVSSVPETAPAGRDLRGRLFFWKMIPYFLISPLAAAVR